MERKALKVVGSRPAQGRKAVLSRTGRGKTLLVNHGLFVFFGMILKTTDLQQQGRGQSMCELPGELQALRQATKLPGIHWKLK